jgi:hypothetical protein
VVSEHPPAAVTSTGVVPDVGDSVKEQVTGLWATAEPAAAMHSKSIPAKRPSLARMSIVAKNLYKFTKLIRTVLLDQFRWKS